MSPPGLYVGPTSLIDGARVALRMSTKVAIRLHCILASAFPCLCAKGASWHGCRVGASSGALLVEFLVSAGVIWGAGIKLSDDTDVLAERLHLGAALGGVILLSIATNLPEIAITVAAALSGNVGVAVGNLLGGTAVQSVVLVVLDAFGVRARRPPAFIAASLTLVLEAALVVAVLLVVLAGSQLQAPAGRRPGPASSCGHRVDQRTGAGVGVSGQDVGST